MTTPTPQDVNDQLATEITRPAATSVGGNSVTRRSLTELLDAQQRLTSNEQGQQDNLGMRRKQFRHRGPAGGP